MPAEPGLTDFLDGLPRAGRAAALATTAHDGQRRDADGAPFVAHPLEVALLVQCLGYGDEVVAAAVLHDVVEKGGVTIEAVRDAFGTTVAGTVAALTEDDGIVGYRERKAGARAKVARAGGDAVVVFAADKLSKAQELRVAVAAGNLPDFEIAGRTEHYLASLELLEDRLPGHALTTALRFELAMQAVVPGIARRLAAPGTADAESLR